jgi:hypothetical protein
VRSTIIAVLVMALIAAGVVVGVVLWRNSTKAPTDWAGTGTTVVVVRVYNGDGLADVGQTLAEAGWWPTPNTSRRSPRTRPR